MQQRMVGVREDAVGGSPARATSRVLLGSPGLYRAAPACGAQWASCWWYMGTHVGCAEGAAHPAYPLPTLLKRCLPA
jgi:hypothetical protein